MLKDLVKEVTDEVIFKKEPEYQHSKYGDTGHDFDM